MIAAFLLPYPVRGHRAPYLWVYYRLLSSVAEPMLVIAGEDYVRDPSAWRDEGRWELVPGNAHRLGYRIPDAASLAAHEHRFLPAALFDTLLAEAHGNPIAVFRRLLRERIAAVEAGFEAIFSARGRDLEMILTWCNCPSLTAAARRHHIPVVHLEMGPLRWPQYRPTAYLDFSGVNGNTEAARRYQASGLAAEAGLDVAGLRRFFLVGDGPQPSVPEADLGVVFQVEDDSNLLAFSNGYDNHALLVAAHLRVPTGRVLVRTHPGSLYALKPGWYEVDDSPDSPRFIRRCRKILTINSSLGVEAMLLDTPVEIMGDCAHRFILDAADERERAARLAFYLFAYLVPMDLIYEPDYLRYRLSRPTEREIMIRHLDTYLGGDAWRKGRDETVAMLIRRALSSMNGCEST